MVWEHIPYFLAKRSLASQSAIPRRTIFRNSALMDLLRSFLCVCLIIFHYLYHNYLTFVITFVITFVRTHCKYTDLFCIFNFNYRFFLNYLCNYGYRNR